MRYMKKTNSTGLCSGQQSFCFEFASRGISDLTVVSYDTGLKLFMWFPSLWKCLFYLINLHMPLWSIGQGAKFLSAVYWISSTNWLQVTCAISFQQGVWLKRLANAFDLKHQKTIIFKLKGINMLSFYGSEKAKNKIK